MKRLHTVVLGTLASPAFAATFVVTHTGDDGAGSLRRAMLDANAASGVHRIEFAIPGAGPHVIAPLSALPSIARAVTIDGYTQPGSGTNTRTPAQGGLDSVLKIEIAGASLVADASGAAAPVVLRGLAIHSVGKTAAIVAYRHGGVRIEGCYVGTDASGTVVPAPIGYGIEIPIDPKDVFIGGTTPAARNLIAGATVSNGSAGIAITRISSTGPFVEGNLIGTDLSGRVALPNNVGIGFEHADADLSGPGARIGGTAAARNLISGNAQRGIMANCSFTGGSACGGGLSILGNFIGTDISGTGALPNGTYGGISFYNVSSAPTRVRIGGDTPAFDNLIAYNLGPGIHHQGAGALDVGGNTIHDNIGGGIDVGGAGPSPNDPGDADEGSNRGQNWPRIVSASVDAALLRVRYRVDTAAAHASWPLRVQFFLALPGGGTPLLVETDGPNLHFAVDPYPQSAAQIEREVSFRLPAGSDPFPLNAIATDAAGHSSEFGASYDPAESLFTDGFEP